MLEIGPGVGIYSLPSASQLAPGGSLDVFDVQQAMLDDVVRSARAAGIDNIVAQQGDAQKLPYQDQAFDAGYLVGVLGEIPDGGAALRELRRVLKPTGRLVVGEVIFDPDFVSFGSLVEEVAAIVAPCATRPAGDALFKGQCHSRECQCISEGHPNAAELHHVPEGVQRSSVFRADRCTAALVTYAGGRASWRRSRVGATVARSSKSRVPSCRARSNRHGTRS
jgi:SAM-dependent methyltransferase